jgi:uncharacterized protein (DUF2236 family)
LHTPADDDSHPSAWFFAAPGASMIRPVVRVHAAVHGTSAQGIHYSANDPRLLNLVPAWIRARLGLGSRYLLQRQERWLASLAGAAAERVIVPSSPAVQSCTRLGLPAAFLYAPGRRLARSRQVLDYQPQPAYFAKQSDRK